MMIRHRRAWELKESEATSESAFHSRREFLAALGLGSAAALLVGCGLGESGDSRVELTDTIPAVARPYPFPRNRKFLLDRNITDPLIAASFNNFYEFSAEKNGVWPATSKFRTEPWTLEIRGLVGKPMKFDVDQLLRSMPVEERLYRHRCVEAWSMAVPWTGFSLASLLRLAEPMSSAKFVRFVSFNRPEQAPGMREQSWYPWPYYEVLRIDEAMHELTMLVTGVYGHALPKQHGSPIRLIVPWKYGYKSAKSIVRIELVAEQPGSFWNTSQPDEYSLESNVNPDIPHPRWSQAQERLIGSGEVRPTLMFNGYGDSVRELYL